MMLQRVHAEVSLGPRVILEDLVAIARYKAKVSFSEAYEKRVIRCREHVERFSRDGQAIYGLTTGLGDNWKKFIPEADRIIIQRNNILAHTCSVGEPLNDECVRAMMAVMLMHFGVGHTGIRLETLILLREMLNADVVPHVPRHGSVGYLCLEGHIGMVLLGEGRAYYKGELLDGGEALARAGLSPTVLGSKEGLTLLSGTTSVTALTALALYDARMLAKTADVIASISLEQLKGTLMAMDKRIMEARPHTDQGKTAHNLRTLLQDSQVVEKHKEHRVQDALSLRCIPQLHGAVKKSIKEGLETLEIELNSAVDNPLIFEEEDGTPVALMGCNADGSYLGMAADFLAIALTDLAKMSERRLDRLVNHHVSELPPFLNQSADFNNGLMMIQYTAAGLLGELRLLANPATVDNVTTCANQEDYVSMGYNAALKAYNSIPFARYILASELICGLQAVDCGDGTPTGSATQAIYQEIRKDVPKMTEDVPITPLTELVAEHIWSGRVLDLAESAVGTLLF